MNWQLSRVAQPPKTSYVTTDLPSGYLALFIRVDSTAVTNRPPNYTGLYTKKSNFYVPNGLRCVFLAPATLSIWWLRDKVPAVLCGSVNP